MFPALASVKQQQQQKRKLFIPEDLVIPNSSKKKKKKNLRNYTSPILSKGFILVKTEINRTLDVGMITHYFPAQTDLKAVRRKLNEYSLSC